MEYTLEKHTINIKSYKIFDSRRPVEDLGATISRDREKNKNTKITWLIQGQLVR